MLAMNTGQAPIASLALLMTAACIHAPLPAPSTGHLVAEIPPPPASRNIPRPVQHTADLAKP